MVVKTWPVLDVHELGTAVVAVRTGGGGFATRTGGAGFTFGVDSGSTGGGALPPAAPAVPFANAAQLV